MVDAVTTRLYELQVRLAADSLKQLKQLEKSTGKIQTGLEGVAAAAKKAAAVIGVGFVTNQVLDKLQRTVDTMDELSKASQKVGVSTEALSELAFAADLAGVSFEQLNAGMVKLTKAAADANTGSAKTAQAFARIGVATEDAGGNLRDAEALFKDVAQAFSTLQDGSEKTAIAVELFGRSGTELIPLLNAGAEGLQQMADQAGRLGLVIDGDAARAAERFNDNMTLLSKTVDGLWIAMAQDLLPVFTEITGVMAQAAEEGGILESIFVGLGGALTALFGFTDAQQATEKVADLRRQVENLNSEIERGNAIRDAEGNVRFANAGLADTIARRDALLAEIDAIENRNQVLTKTPALTLPPVEDAAESIKAFEAINRSLEDQLTQLQAVGEESETYLVTQKKIFENIKLLSRDQQVVLLDKAAEIDAIRKQQAAEESLLAVQKEGLRLTESLRTPAELLNDERTRAKALLDANAISQETYNRAVAQSVENFENAQKASDKLKASSEALTAVQLAAQQSLDRYSGQLTDALFDIATGAKTAQDAFADFALSVLENVAKMITELLIVKPLMNSIGVAFGIPGLTPAANGAVFDTGGVTKFASGGIVTSPTLFGMAGGGAGLMGEAGPEAVMPLARAANGDLGVKASASPVTVNVINNNGSQVGVEERDNGDGSKTITILVERAVENAITRGRFDSTLGATYGLNRRAR